MRVRISANPPLPPVRAWFPLTRSAQTISSFKSTLCTTIPALRDFSPHLLRLSIDGFELLDSSELDIVRDGDLICIDVLDAPVRDNVVNATQRPGAPRKRKRSLSSSSSSSSSKSESGSSTESDTETSSDSDSDAEDSPRSVRPPTRKTGPPKAHVKTIQPTATFVPPGYGKPQTRSRNLRRRLKRMHECNVGSISESGPVSGANTVVQGESGQVPDANADGHAVPALMSLTLRNKNKAKSFKSLMKRPLPPKIIFGEHDATPRVAPRLVPPSSRTSLPPNIFVTSVDVEADLRRDKRKGKMRIEYEDGVEEEIEGEGVVDAVEPELDVDAVEVAAEHLWDSLAELTSDTQITPGMLVGYKGLGINPETYTPEEVVTVGVVVGTGEDGLDVRPLRAVSFGGPVDGEVARHTWFEMKRDGWKIVRSA